MCYPCTMCNGCGKFDQELFRFMLPKPYCIACGEELRTADDADATDAGADDHRSCPHCGAPLPPQPGKAALIQPL